MRLMSDEQKAYLPQRYRDYTQQELAEIFNVHQSTISRWMKKKYSLFRTPQKLHKNLQHYNQLRKMCPNMVKSKPRRSPKLPRWKRKTIPKAQQFSFSFL